MINNDDKNLNSKYKNITAVLIIYILIIGITKYIFTHKIPHDLLSIFFFYEFIKSFFEYKTSKKVLNLIVLISCLVVVISLVILMLFDILSF